MTNPDTDYHGSKLYRPEWKTPTDIMQYLDQEVFEGRVLNVCCGPHNWGDVTVDVDPSHNPDRARWP